ncbi:MAG TPA: site-specific integrase [Candidatus Kapabacteria bacterium]|nr:site-specific integrase [Candidatus Kapabacteria bacterium]
MATVKIVLRKKANKDGTFPLALRITKDRKASFIHLGYHLSETAWDAATQRVRKTHPNAARLNNFLMKKLSEANDTALELATQQSEASSRTIKRKIRPTADTMFFARADIVLQRLKDAGNFNVWRSRTSELRTFKEFALGTRAIWDELAPRARAMRHTPIQGVFGGQDVPFQRIDVSLLTQFKVYLKARRGVGNRTVANYLIAIQSIFSQAIKEGVIDRKYYPFGTDKIQIKIPPSQKIGLTKEDVEKLEAAAFVNPEHAEARDLWLISFTFAGIRAADVLKLRWSDFKDGRLHYVMNKNEKPVSLKAPEKALRILARYEALKERPDGFVFSFLAGLEEVEDAFVLKERILTAVKKCDRLLAKHVAPAAGIEGKLTMHIARHTFATLAGDKIPIQMLQKLYRHSDIKTTLGYQANFIHKDADDALDKVVG